ncbi:MAG TPA: hypothetical protein VGG87_06100 [Solirubrobacteraceae bacterium]
MLRLRVLSWNLGPENARWQDLAAVLSGWDWDVAALRGLPPRWPLPLSKSLDAEFRYAPADREDASWLRRLVSGGPVPLVRSPAGPVDAIMARRDRIVSEWPADDRRLRQAGVHVARLACGIWVGNRQGTGDDLVGELAAAIGSEALALAGPRGATGIDALVGLAGAESPTESPGLSLIEVASGGEDVISATPDLIPVTDAEVLAGGAVRGNPPLAVTLEHRVQDKPGRPGDGKPDRVAQ